MLHYMLSNFSVTMSRKWNWSTSWWMVRDYSYRGYKKRRCPSYTDSHRCPLHNDTLEHDCTTKNIVPGLIVPGDGQLDTPQAVEDWCICSSLHIHGNSVNVRYYHRCPVHNDTLEHNCTHNNIVTGQSNFVQFGELPETINMAQPVGDTCICSMLHIQGKVVQKYYKRCPVHNDNEEHIYWIYKEKHCNGQERWTLN